MESQTQQPEYIDTTSPEVIEALETKPLAKLPPAPQSNQQWQQISSQFSESLAKLPDNLGHVFNAYKQQIITLAVIVAALIALRLVLAVLDTLNDIPFLAPTFELIGIGYSIWFVSRYLLKDSKRQDLSKEIEGVKKEVVGS